MSSLSCQTKVGKCFWLIVVLLGFTGAFYLIYSSYAAWEESPISTTITTHPLSSLDFPIVTICPPKDSNTALFPDLMRADNNSLTEENRQHLKSSIKETMKVATFDYAASLLEISNRDNLGTILEGGQSLPKQYGTDGFEVTCESINGSIQSPRFGEEYRENDYKADRFIHIILDVANAVRLIKSVGNFVVNLEVDTRREMGWSESVEFREGPRYILFPQLKTWLGADAYCKRRGEQLATILSYQELQDFENEKFKINRMFGVTTNHMWIGARKIDKKADFLWVDGSKVDMGLKVKGKTFFDSLVQSALCMGVDSKLNWHEKDCNDKRAFVCKTNPQVLKEQQTMTLQYNNTHYAGGNSLNPLNGEQADRFWKIHVWYKYKASKAQMLDSWPEKRSTGFRLSWNAVGTQNHLILQKSKSLKTSKLGEKLLFKDFTPLPDVSYVRDIKFDRYSMSKYMGSKNTLVIDIKVENRNGEMNEWVKVFEGFKYTYHRGLFEKGLSWAKAQASCLKEGKTLATVKTKSELHYLADGVYSAWLGGRRSEDGIWRWVDGNIAWENESLDGCAFLDKTYLIQRNCSLSAFYLCQAKPSLTGDSKELSINFTKQQLAKDNDDDGYVHFEVWYHHLKSDNFKWQNVSTGALKLSWYITGKNATSKDEQMVFPYARNTLLDKMTQVAVKAKSQGMTREEIIVGALNEKGRLEGKGEIVKCYNGQMYLRR